MGTSNDVARALGIPLDPVAAATIIRDGVPTEVDTGRVREASGDARRERVPAWRRVMSRWLPRWVLDRWERDPANSLYFLHAATLGLNAEFAHLAMDADRRAALGSLAYPASSLEALTHLRAIPVKLRLSGVPAQGPATGGQLEGGGSEMPEAEWQVSLETDVLQLAVVNTPIFGGALNLSLPGVSAHDHLLDVVLVESLRLDKGLDTVRAVIQGLRRPRGPLRGHRLFAPVDQHQEREDHRRADLARDVLFPGIRRYRARAISIETAEPSDVTLDGEVCCKTPVQIWVEPAKLTVLLPGASADVLGGGSTEASVQSSTEMPS